MAVTRSQTFARAKGEAEVSKSSVAATPRNTKTARVKKAKVQVKQEHDVTVQKPGKAKIKKEEEVRVKHEDDAKVKKPVKAKVKKTRQPLKARKRLFDEIHMSPASKAFVAQLLARQEASHTSGAAAAPASPVHEPNNPYCYACRLAAEQKPERKVDSVTIEKEDFKDVLKDHFKKGVPEWFVRDRISGMLSNMLWATAQQCYDALVLYKCDMDKAMTSIHGKLDMGGRL